MLSLIYARTRNHIIGDKGELPWSLPDEFLHFQTTTQGCPLIMGRISYQDQHSALADCPHIVVTSQADLAVAGDVYLASDLHSAITIAQQLNNQLSREIFVIGGSKLFIEAFPLVNTVYETIIDTVIPGDTYLPPFDFSQWHSELLLDHPPDQQHAFRFQAFKRDLALKCDQR